MQYRQTLLPVMIAIIRCNSHQRIHVQLILGKICESLSLIITIIYDLHIITILIIITIIGSMHCIQWPRQA